MMVNISKSGVLFETDHSVAWLKTALEMRFAQGPDAGSLGSVCYGLIVRAVTKPGSVPVTALAVRITKFHFVRPAGSSVA